MERLVVALVKLLLLMAMVLGAFAFACRNSLATALFARALSRQDGLSCTQPSVRISASLTQISVSPLRCRVAEGPVKGFETGEARLRVLGLRIRKAHLDFATVDYHDRDVSGARSSVRDSVSAGAPGVLTLRQLLMKTMLDGSEMYSLDSPEVSVNKLTAKRAGRVQLVMYGFRKTVDGAWNRSQAERVECPADPRLAVRDLDMRVLPRTGTVSAALLLGPQMQGSPPRELKLEGRQLDGLRPRFSLVL